MSNAQVPSSSGPCHDGKRSANISYLVMRPGDSLDGYFNKLFWDQDAALTEAAQDAQGSIGGRIVVKCETIATYEGSTGMNP